MTHIHCAKLSLACSKRRVRQRRPCSLCRTSPLIIQSVRRCLIQHIHPRVSFTVNFFPISPHVCSPASRIQLVLDIFAQGADRAIFQCLKARVRLDMLEQTRQQCCRHVATWTEVNFIVIINATFFAHVACVALVNVIKPLGTLSCKPIESATVDRAASASLEMINLGIFSIEVETLYPNVPCHCNL